MVKKRQKHQKSKKTKQKIIKRKPFKIPKVDLTKVQIFKKDMNTNLLILLVILFVCFSLISVWYAFNISKVREESHQKSDVVRKLIEDALNERDKQVQMANEKSMTIKQNYEYLYYDILREYQRVKSQCGSSN